jgi:hypothetical protein
MGKLPVEQRHREAAADFYGPHLSRPGEVLVTAHMRAGKIDESPLVQTFARFEAEHLTRIEATPAVDREGVASLFDEALNEHGPAGYGRDTPMQVAFGQVLSKLRRDILALPPVKQSDGWQPLPEPPAKGVVFNPAGVAAKIAEKRLESAKNSRPAGGALGLAERVREALEPFSTFADTFIDEEGWNGPMRTTRIVDWFGPSDFRRAASAIRSLDITRMDSDA